jgi:hypothetical protein
MQYEFSGKLFSVPERITNDRVIGVHEIEKACEPDGVSPWIMNREMLPKMMRYLLDGPHDDIDWIMQETAKCRAAYNDFFAVAFPKATT